MLDIYLYICYNVQELERKEIKRMIGYYDDGFNEWSEGVANTIGEPDESLEGILYYIISGVVYQLCNIANELHDLNNKR